MIQIDAPNEAALAAVKKSIAKIEQHGIMFEPHMTIPSAPQADTQPEGRSHYIPKTRYQSCIKAENDDIRRGQYKLSSAIDMILDAKTMSSLNSYIDIMTAANEWNPDEAGYLKWSRLEYLFENKGRPLPKK